MSEDVEAMVGRKGARRMADVPPEVLARLARGEAETLNLMEWLAVDMAGLATALASQICSSALKEALMAAAANMSGIGVTGRLTVAGRAVASTVSLADEDFLVISRHRSDLVRQWAAYAVNDPCMQLSLHGRLEATLAFASDPNMSVREAAWMAFRPHVAADVATALVALTEVAAGSDVNRRRFAVEVCRPRSVWGAHLPALKARPESAEPLLDRVRADQSRYVQLAVGNWINDASKTRPDWTLDLAARWLKDAEPATFRILQRGLRTLPAGGSEGTRDLFPTRVPEEIGAMLKRGRTRRC